MQRYILREGIFLIIFLFNSDYIYLSCLQTERKSADSVVFIANVITIDANNPRAEAFAVLNGRIIAGGITSEMKVLIGNTPRVIDIQGKTVTPA